jgi:hypothetical protein
MAASPAGPLIVAAIWSDRANPSPACQEKNPGRLDQ